ncbi:MAG: addiction module protein [Myxococcota bacterium]
MSTSQADFPEGFEGWSTEDQVEYVSELWQVIAGRGDELPVHDWQKRAIDEAIAEHDADPSGALSGEESIARARALLGSRRGEG